MADPTFQIPKDVIEPIIQAHVSAAVAVALGNQSHLLNEVIGRVLNQKVGSDGKPSNYSSNDSFIQWATRDCVQTAVKNALAEEIERYAPVLKKHIADQLSKKNSPLLKQLADGMVNALASESVLKWRLTVNCEQA